MSTPETINAKTKKPIILHGGDVAHPRFRTPAERKGSRRAAEAQRGKAAEAVTGAGVAPVAPAAPVKKAGPHGHVTTPGTTAAAAE